ncbi:MAG: hypothetical protein ACE5KT_03055 [Methanosarcinales archaeon]
MTNPLKTYNKIYQHLFRSKYTVLGLLALFENEGKLERPRFRELVECRDFNKYVMIPLLDLGLIQVYEDRRKYPYKTYVTLTEKGKEVASKIKSCVEDVSEIL